MADSFRNGKTQFGAVVFDAGDVNVITASFGTRPVLTLNSKDFNYTTGSTIGAQCKPRQTATTTGDVIGVEISPRVSDAGSGALICLKADPVVQTATSARTLSAVRGVEVNIDFPDSGSAYTVTNDVSAIRVFPDFGAGHTFSGARVVLNVANPNTSQLTHLMTAGAANATWISTAGASASIPANTGFVLIQHGATTFRIPVYANS